MSQRVTGHWERERFFLLPNTETRLNYSLYTDYAIPTHTMKRRKMNYFDKHFAQVSSDYILFTCFSVVYVATLSVCKNVRSRAAE